MTFNRLELVNAAQLSIAHGSKSFTLASQLFDGRTRERAWLLYYWCRACDDIVDGQAGGGELSQVDRPLERVAEVRALTQAALRGQRTGREPFDALGLVAAECAIPPQLPHDVIDGFVLDADGWQPRTQTDLLQYCYHVAGAVGRMMALVMGVSPSDRDTLDRATDLGLAFQLGNIARDLHEDARAGRCYVPAEWLAEVGPLSRDTAASYGTRLADLAEQHEASARVGAARLPFRARWAVLAAAGIYGDIAREVRARGPAAWDARVVTGKRQKLAWVARALGQALRNNPQEFDRTGLWTLAPSG